MKRLKYKEILKLAQMLLNNGIPFEMKDMWNGKGIAYPSIKECVCSVIEHDYSYGHEQDLLEIKGLLSADEAFDGEQVVGYLNADEVFHRIRTDWYCRTI